MLSDDLLKTARLLTAATQKKPRQADLRRAVSTAYYALFHAIARQAADSFATTGENQSHPAWVQVYRSLDHGTAKDACRNVAVPAFPYGLVTCANSFITLQEERHQADYNPDYRTTRADAQTRIDEAEAAITALNTASPKDRRAFLIHLIIKKRR